MKDKLPVIVLAGSPDERDLLMEYADVDYKALIDINGKPMVSYVLEAIAQANIASHLLVVGIPKDLVELPPEFDAISVEFLELTGEAFDKIYQASLHLLDHENQSIFSGFKKHAVFCTADSPGLTGDSIRRHMEKIGNREADFYYPAVQDIDMDEQYPNNKRTYIKLNNGRFAGGDLMVVNLEKVKDDYDLVKHTVTNRKTFLKGVFFASPIIFFRLILGRVGKEHVEKLMSKVFGFDSRLVITKDAGIAFDVDKPHQLDLAREIIK